jgi:nickel/cobalt exporter
MTRNLRIALLIMLVAGITSLALPTRASAHPMGNFSINQYSALTVGDNSVKILYIIDVAEIPTFQELGAIRSDHSSDLTPEQKQSYISQKAASLVQGLSLKVDGTTVPLKLGETSLTFPLGSGGLPTMRLEMNLSAELSGSAGKIEYSDTNFSDRIGWREVVAVPAQGTLFKEASVPQVDQTARLTKYAASATSNVLNTTSATLTFAPGTALALTAQTVPTDEGVVDWAKQRVDDVAGLISQENLSFGAMLIGLLIAFVWGAGHALSPGHGKTVVAAYLDGTRGTAKHAALLGLTVTVSHTIGVFALGFIVLFAANFIVPDMLYPVIGFISGMSIVVMGMVMFAQRFRTWHSERKSKNALAEGHTEHVHGDDFDPTVPHSHGAFSKPHTHAPASEGKVSMKGLLTLGITGGIIPCPTALVVLLAAVAYHRIALGLAWIFSFSLGLAAVLTILGLMVVYGKGLLSRFDRSRLKFGTGIMARLPMASAVMVAVLGFMIAFQSLR